MASCLRLVSVVATLCLIPLCSAGYYSGRLPNLTNPEYLPPARESHLIKLPESIPLGEIGSQDTLIVWRNGLVTFGVESLTADLSKPTLNFSTVEAEYFVAPLWFPGGVSPNLLNSTVSWQQQREGEPGSLLDLASDTVNDYSYWRYSEPTYFNPTWAIIVDWNVTLAPSFDKWRSICRNYHSCECTDNDYYYYYYEYYEYYYNGASGGSAGCEIDPDCHSNLGWSPSDVDYLALLCARRHSYLYRYYHVGVHFQLVLASDGENTHAVALHQQDNFFSYDIGILNFIYNETAVGYRLGDTIYNDTCVSGDIPEVFRIRSFPLCENSFQLQEFRYAIHGLFYNLTDAFSQFQFFTTLAPGYDYIPFQLLYHNNDMYNSSGSGTNSLDILSLSRRLFEASVPVVHSGLSVGTTTQTNIYVGSNGIISFGRPYYFWYPRRFPTRYPWIRDTYVAAPFWHDADIRGGGDVLYSVLEPGDSAVDDIFSTVNRFIEYQQNVTFKAEWMLIALWHEVPVYPHYYLLKYGRYYSDSFKDRVLNNVNTFEAILVSSGPDTYVIFTYNCLTLTNPGAYSQAVIGYNLGGFEYLNNRYSESFGANRIACSHWPSSNWFNLIYKLNTGQDKILQAQRECRELLAADEGEYPAKDISEYKSNLSPCPCSIRNAWRDRNYRWDSDNYYCYYRRFANPLTGSFDQYCCYDTDFSGGSWGALVKSGHRVSGIARLDQKPDKRTLSYEDRRMRDVCCGLAGLCDLYQWRRPPDDCTGYEPPAWTWGMGDPHMTTLDGLSYTFNGYGEYILLRYVKTDGGDTVEVQGRMSPTPGTSATQFSSFAIGSTAGSRVEVNCGNPESFCTTWYYNTSSGSHVNISDQLSSVNDSVYYSSDLIEVVRESQTTVTVVTGLGITLAVNYNSSAKIPSFQLTLDPSLSSSGTIRGLLGNSDGDPENDLMDPTGALLDGDSPSEQDLFTFFNDHWRITLLANSLFNYPSGMGLEDFYNSSWTPAFTSEVVAGASQQVIDSCTPEGATEPVEQCVFDAVETGDINVGMATMDTLKNNTLAMQESTNMPPVILSEEDTIRATLWTPLILPLSVSDDTDASVSLTLISAPPGSSLSPGQQPGHYTFSITLPELAEDMEIPPLVFSAIDSLEAAATFTPRLELCACQNGGNCTLDGVLSNTVTIMNCICPPAWEGRYCQRDVDGCLEFACMEGVECIDVAAPGQGAECGPCPQGYSGDGVKCVDVDECVVEGSPCQQVCTNTEGSYECSCNRGYLVDPNNSSGCVDFDECEFLVAGCEQECTNTEGSFTCSCRDGFISQGTACSPEKPCDDLTNPCGAAKCANLSQGSPCYCDSGYQLNSTETGCDDEDECSYGYCQHDCTNLPGTFVCSCDSGYALGPDRLSCVDIDECQTTARRGIQLCPEGEVCLNDVGGFSCICAPGQYRVAMVKPDDSVFNECDSPIVDEAYAEESVTVILHTTLDQLLEEGVIDAVSRLVVRAVEGYCSDSLCEVIFDATPAMSDRLSPRVYNSTSDHLSVLFDLDFMDGGRSVTVALYVEVVTSEGAIGVLSSTSTQAALQRCITDQECGGLLSLPPPSLTDPPATQPEEEDTGLDIAVVAGVTAAAAVASLGVATVLALSLYCCVIWCSKMKSSVSDKQGLLKSSVSWSSDGKGAREMTEVPPHRQVMEEPGKTIIVNPST